MMAGWVREGKKGRRGKREEKKKKTGYTCVIDQTHEMMFLL